MISIAMTFYNGEKHIERQLETIMAQSLAADEIVICDDCSKDRTVEIIRTFIEKSRWTRSAWLKIKKIWDM